MGNSVFLIISGFPVRPREPRGRRHPGYGLGGHPSSAAVGQGEGDTNSHLKKLEINATYIPSSTDPQGPRWRGRRRPVPPGGLRLCAGALVSGEGRHAGRGQSQAGGEGDHFFVQYMGESNDVFLIIICRRPMTSFPFAGRRWRRPSKRTRKK